MPQPTDRRGFGKAVKELRKRKGLGQQAVADRVSGHYADVSSYRRIENGTRIPERNAAIAILVHGLELRDIARIDSLLALVGYDPLSRMELGDLGLRTADAADASTLAPEPLRSTPLNVSTRVLSNWYEGAGVGIAAGLSAALCSRSEYGTELGLLLSALYAGLYVVSLLLESAYQPEVRRRSASVLIFCLMLASSSAALAADATAARPGSVAGLVVAISIFGAAAGGQVGISGRALPDYPVVRGRYQMHTAQTAHLKNTCYFLLIVVLFWIPPLHAVTILRRELQMGHRAFVWAAAGRWVLLGHGMVSLNYGWLLGLFIATLLISLPMRTQLLDNLRPHPNQHSYIRLFYIRALLYFVLSGTCVAWYAYAVGSLLDQATL